MISKEMPLLELMQRYPETKEYLESRGMQCGRCMGAVEETVEMAAKQHGIELESLLRELNKLVGNG